jgi:hypothetical protein
MYNYSMKLKTLLAIIALSTIGFIGGGLSAFNNLNAIDGNLETQDAPIQLNSDNIVSYYSYTIPGGYYEFQGTVTSAQRITISGDVHLNLATGADVTITGGIQCEVYVCELTITSTSTGDDMGELTATTSQTGYAGIGGNINKAAGTINIEGGTISATGGSEAAGIGGGSNGNCGTVNILGGTIKSAQGGPMAAGIGGGRNHNGGGIGGKITISDGIIESAAGGTGANGGAGIGGGLGGNGGEIAINGGTITATGASGAAGIGGGYAVAADNITITAGDITATGGNSAAGIGGGYLGDGGTIKISGGTIRSAQGGDYAAGIGGGRAGNGGEITITGGEITAQGGNDGGAGIGGGLGDGTGGNGGTIEISGNATIKKAQGGNDGGSEFGGGAGIGGGSGLSVGGIGGTIEISGNATIEKALGGDYAAGIGGGDRGKGETITISDDALITEVTGGQYGAGIGGGSGKDGGTINIEGGIIAETQGGYQAAGIGGGSGGDGGKITIFDDAIITKAIGGDLGAGIGGGAFAGGDTIKIKGGNISAEGGDEGAGIGGGEDGDGDEITIEGGTISAVGRLGGAGIGNGDGGSASTIKITGGTITAVEGSSGSAAGIGKGDGGNGVTTKITGGSIKATSINPVPTNGSVDVFLNKLTVDGFEGELVTRYYQSDYGLDDVYTDSDATLYFYLPATSGAELVALSFDEELEGNEVYYGKSYTRSTSAIEQYLPYLQLAKPEAEIDFTYELLTGLIPETAYDISVPLEEFSLKPLSSTLADDSGIIEIDENWIGADIEIILRSDGVPYGDSEAQVLDIKPRPEATDELKALVSTKPASEGDKGKVSGLKVGMAYSTDPNAAPDEWILVDSEDDLELAPGTYYFRKAATGDTFATEYITIVIPGYQEPVVPNEPANPDSSAEPLGLAGTGVNLDLAYLLVVVLLLAGCFIPARTVIPAKAGI